MHVDDGVQIPSARRGVVYGLVLDNDGTGRICIKRKYLVSSGTRRDANFFPFTYIPSSHVPLSLSFELLVRMDKKCQALIYERNYQMKSD